MTYMYRFKKMKMYINVTNYYYDFVHRTFSYKIFQEKKYENNNFNGHIKQIGLMQ